MQTIIKLLKKPVTSTIIAILFGFIALTIVLLIAGYNPSQAYTALFNGVFGRPKYMSNLIIKSTPIIITGLGVAFAYKTGLFNIGAEGQYILGTIAVAIIGCSIDLPPIIMVPFLIIAGASAGALWGGICGALKAKFGINEVITSIMLNWIALYLNNYIVNLPYLHAENTNATRNISNSSLIMLLEGWKKEKVNIETLKRWPVIYDILIKTDVNFGILIAIALCILISILLYKTTKGFELRAVGQNRDAAEFAGINVNKNIIQAMVISGAICGIAGAVTIMGTNPHRISQLAGFQNNGFNGLAVAFIAMGSPIGCIFSGLLFGGLLYGGQNVQSEINAPTEVINIMIGIIVFFVALGSIMPTIIAKLEKRQFEKSKMIKEARR